MHLIRMFKKEENSTAETIQNIYSDHTSAPSSAKSAHTR